MSRVVAEGPYEPGTITLVDADTDTNLHYGGGSRRVLDNKYGTNISLAKPGMRVRKRWNPSSEPEGEGMIVAVEETNHVYGPTIHVLWSKSPNSFYVDIPGAKKVRPGLQWWEEDDKEDDEEEGDPC